jgi:thiamine-phosphate diphosphorylase/hydroxyethylthiazole kinase
VLKEIVDSVPIPVVAIGGINLSNVAEVVSKAKPAGIACVSAIMSAKHPKEAAENMLKAIKSAHANNPAQTQNTVPKIKEKILFAFTKIKAVKPLIHHITNYVVMNITANATLHVGGLPVMAIAPEEVEEMATKSNAIVLNAGTPTKELKATMISAGGDRTDIHH